MAWNGSNGASAPKQKPVNGARAVSKGAIAGVIVVLGAAAALYFLMPASAPSPKASAPKEKSTAIAEATPEIAEKRSTSPEKPLEKTPTVVTNFNEKGVWYDDRGRPHYKPARTIVMGSRTVIGGKPWVPPRQIFSHPSEVELDRVLSAQPGDRILGETNWRLFEKDLQEALISPIHFDPEDSPEEIQRKKDVIEAKKELAGMIGDGLNPSDVLRQAQDELNNLANLYDDLNTTLYEARTSEGITEEEIADYVQAANRMLESKGIFAKKFYTPEEIREKAAAAKQRRLEKQMGY